MNNGAKGSIKQPVINCDKTNLYDNLYTILISLVVMLCSRIRNQTGSL